MSCSGGSVAPCTLRNLAEYLGTFGSFAPVPGRSQGALQKNLRYQVVICPSKDGDFKHQK